MSDSPLPREISPSPSLSPTLAIGACPILERSVSTASSASSFSTPSSASRSSDTSRANNRRGYLRPQGTSFADSARNRESVMNLGSIAHLQYYFARTGLLEGKGGVLCTGKSKVKGSDVEVAGLSLSPLTLSGQDSTYSSMRPSPDPAMLGEGDLLAVPARDRSPTEEEDEESEAWENQDESEPIMLPPTVSTYNYPTRHVPPPPTIEALRKQLRDSLNEASRLLEDLARDSGKETNVDKSTSTPERTDNGTENTLSGAPETSSPSKPNLEMQGWFEIQGMHVLDVMTLAIRAAKLYYTAHDQPAKLNAIRPERKIREDLLTVLDALKKMAIRNFASGIRPDERRALHAWVSGVEDLLAEEVARERAEVQERDSWDWMHGEWVGEAAAREREWVVLRCFDPAPGTLPAWTAPDDANGALPTDFLKTMQTGLRLVHLHNAMVRKSKRVFELITVFHTDTLKPYRCADNLRYWIKAAELRWEISLKIDVLAVVYGHSDDAWKKFDAEILRWCAKVREEIAAEVRQPEVIATSWL
ncbi:MAG: hypothetical protein M4579_007125 [Chaenotheca gracillima]|nr:MAG: hypothetical protein M4579_007125 [Chaenotheca gracillima]